MSTRIPTVLLAAGLTTSLMAGRPVASGRATPPRAEAPADDGRTIAHVLNRIGYGPRPGDVERVRGIGLQRYIEQQLHPEQVSDPGIDARLARLTTLRLSSREIAERYAIPALEARRDRKAADASADAQPGANAQPPPEIREANRVLAELAEQKLLRAAFSERQLQEVLTDFWFNHFNVDARKGPGRFLLTEYERDVIRPRVLGRFRDLLGGVARSPAMLFYLDNWLNADPDGPHDRGRPRTGPLPNGKRAPRGLNENYGRELLELHTLGVDGGYTQADVTEIARAFTGWTIDRPRAGGGFRFAPRLHDAGRKVVLGHAIAAGGGEADGERVLDILARHPSTARFISTKLAARFVSDTPPPALVDRLAARFLATDGDLRDVMRTLLASPEFLAADAVGAKTKTPLEFVVSAVRRTGADVADINDARPLVRAVQELGMPLYMCQPPTGYKDTAEAWVNAGALVGRMNVALTISRQSSVDRRQSAVDGRRSLALELGSPDFQKK